MDEQQARKILGDKIQPDGDLYTLDGHLRWQRGEECVVLGGSFDVQELEAIAWWMKHKGHTA